MNSHRLKFYGGLSHMRSLLSEPLLVDGLPHLLAQNTKAQALRRGLAVVVFSALERYVEDCVEALLAASARPSFPYTALPEALRSILTVDAVAGIATRMGFLEKPARRQFVETEISKLAAFGGEPPSYSAAGFSPRGSNVSHEDIKQLFLAYGVPDPWRRLSDIASTIGASRLSLLDDFKNISAARHKCAHDPSYVLPTSDLATHLEACTTIAMCVDILSMKCEAALARATNSATLAAALQSPLPRCRFLDEEAAGSARLLEHTTVNSARAYRRHDDLASAIGVASSRRFAETIVVRDISRRPFLFIWAPGP